MASGRILTVVETGSTNDDVAALAAAGEAERVWVRAERQSGGRGRHGRDWVSPPGNLHASTLVRLRPTDPPAAQLAMVAAVALEQVVGAYAGADRLMLKWPNDLLARTDAGWAKLSGILLERQDDGVVVGFGVNLASHPDDLDRLTTSVAALSGHAPDPSHFLAQLQESFAYWLGRWRGGGRVAPVRARWLERAHPLGTALTARLPSGPPLTGLFDGLDADGALRLKMADGSVRTVHAADVMFG